MASTSLSKTFASAGNQKTFTFSAWIKRSGISGSMTMFGAGADDNNRLLLAFSGDDSIVLQNIASGVGTTQLGTSQLFRDTSAWYHIVIAYDTTQATDSNRIKIYINGSQVTSFATTNYPSQDSNQQINGAVQHFFAKNIPTTPTNYFDGSMAHVHFIDGTAYDASAFGLTDSASGIWKPKPSPSVTYGTNGFFLNFANSSDLGNDVSGNNNDFTMSGTGTQTLDTPSNVFATMNPLINYASDPTYSLGNLKLVSGGGAWHGSSATLAVSQGKWYWEVKLTGTMTNHFIGVQSINGNASAASPMAITGTTLFYNNDGGDMVYDGSAQAPGNYGLFSSGDIMGLALDMDAGSYGQITIYKNGVALVSDFNLANTTSDTVYPFIAGLSSTQEINFGNGYFGTTAVASANSDTAGLGQFEYSVPTGYYALCTKNIAEYG